MKQDSDRASFAVVAAVVALVIAVIGVVVLVNQQRSSGDDRRKAAAPPPAKPTDDWFRFSDLVAVSADGQPVTTGAREITGNTGKLAAALSLLPEEDLDHPEFRGAVERLRASVAADVEKFGGGDRSLAAPLAEVLMLQRLSNRELVRADEVDTLATALVAAGPATTWSADVGGTYWLRSEVARRMLERGDEARADTLAQLDPAFACGIAGGADAIPLDAAVTLSYVVQRGAPDCVRAAIPGLTEKLLDQLGPSAVHALDQIGAGDDAVRAKVAAWLDQGAASEAAAALSPQGVADLAPAVFVGGKPAPERLLAAAQRTARVSALVPDTVTGQYSLDAYLFAQLDEARGRTVWSPSVTTAAQLDQVARGDWATMVLVGSGAGAADRSAVEALRSGCGADAPSTTVPPASAKAGGGSAGAPPFALLERLAVEYARTPCADVSADSAAAEVASSTSVPAALGDRFVAWASTYIGCRYATSSAQEDALRDRARARSWSAPLAWSLADNPADYYPMFDAYAAQWLDQFVVGRLSCADLTLWPQA